MKLDEIILSDYNNIEHYGKLTTWTSCIWWLRKQIKLLNYLPHSHIYPHTFWLVSFNQIMVYCLDFEFCYSSTKSTHNLSNIKILLGEHFAYIEYMITMLSHAGWLGTPQSGYISGSPCTQDYIAKEPMFLCMLLSLVMDVTLVKHR